MCRTRLPEVDRLAVGERPRQPVGEVVERHHAAQRAVRDRGGRRRREPVVHRAALVGLDMAEGDPAQTVERQHARVGRRDGPEHPARAAMEQQRLVGDHEELVEGEAGRRGNRRHEGRQSIEAVGNLVDPGGHFQSSPVGRPMAVSRCRHERKKSAR